MSLQNTGTTLQNAIALQNTGDTQQNLLSFGSGGTTPVEYPYDNSLYDADWD